MAADIVAVRVYASLRTAHLERFREMVPARVLYNRTRYDFDDSLLSPEDRPVRKSRWGVVKELLTRRYDVIEINEPLMSTRWLDLLAQVAAVRIRSGFGRRRTLVVAYAIGYSDPADDIAERRPVPVRLARAWTKVMALVLISNTDRLAFGTSGSLQFYGRYVSAAALARKARVFEALPSACECLVESVDTTRETSFVFVGAFDERKGTWPMLRMWERLSANNPDFTLLLVGKGKLLIEVQEWAAGREEVTLEVDPPRARIHAALRRRGTLILLSQRIGTWREQVGLPIVEGLAHGCEIVTTTETGLADWLQAHGHIVLDPVLSPSAMADAIQRRPAVRSRAEIVRDLPAEDQRIAADRWMLSDRSATGEHVTGMDGAAGLDGPGIQRIDAISVVFQEGRGLARWQERAAEGPVPGLWPYGLEGLASSGRSVTPVEVAPLGPVERRVMTRLGIGPRRHKSSAGIALSWDERAAVPMMAHIAAARHYSGVIWATDAVAAGGDSRELELVRRALLRTDGLWCLSRPQVEAIRRWLGSDAPAIDFVRFGVDETYYSPTAYPVSPKVVSLGGDRDRDPATLFAALEIVKTARPDVECVVQSKSSVAAPPGIVKIPSLLHAEVRELYAGASVIAVATRPNWHASGMTVALEGLSVARPVVACDTAGMDDYIESGVTGYLVPPADPEQLAGRILDLLDDRDRAIEMGLAGRSSVEEHYNTTAMCERLLEIIS